MNFIHKPCFSIAATYKLQIRLLFIQYLLRMVKYLTVMVNTTYILMSYVKHPDIVHY